MKINGTSISMKLIAVVSLAFIGVIGSVLVLLFGGEKGALYAGLILGFLSPIIVAILAVQVREVEAIVNSKATIMANKLEETRAEVSRLQAPGSFTPGPESPKAVTITDSGHVDVKEPEPKGG